MIVIITSNNSLIIIVVVLRLQKMWSVNVASLLSQTSVEWQVDKLTKEVTL